MKALKIFAVAALSAWLASCATSPPAPVTTPMTPDEQARAAERSGEYALAAEYWLEAASTASAPASDSLRLNAAEALLRSGNRRQAFITIELLQEPSLSAANRQRYWLIRAEQALAEGNARAALEYIDAQGAWLDVAFERRAAAIQDRIAQFQSGAGAELLQRISNDLAPVNAFNLTEAIALLTRYEYVPSGKLREASLLAELNARAASWADLMTRLRQGMLKEDELIFAADRWVQDYPEHEVGREEFLELGYLYSQRYRAPASVAVLLPTKGGLAAAGSAIRDGLVSAYLESPGTSELNFYEPGETPDEAIAAYETAFQNGADWVVGPVRQSSVQAIAELERPDSPTLALNDTVPTKGLAMQGRFFSLSLSQEAEATAIARKMLQAGIDRVITLTASSAWGNRMEVAFVEAFTSGGGQVVDVARFSTTDSDHSTELTRVLQIDQSRDRKDRLQSLLGTALSFEPRLRDDFDAFFLSSIPEQARQIRPQLRFFEAGEKPLFAVSRVYSGIPDPTADRDLNGTILPLNPLQLEAANGAPPAISSAREGSMLNLYALGQDAWDVLRWLPLLQADPDLGFPGESGTLNLRANGMLDREPAWAMFVAGRPVAHDPAAQSD